MSGPHHTVSRTGNGHLGKLKDGIIGGGKLAVGGEARNPCVLEIPRDNGPKPVKLSLACGVCLHAVIAQ